MPALSPQSNLHRDASIPDVLPVPAWPPIQAVIGKARAARFLERLKYTARTLASRPHRDRFMAYLSQQQAWREMFIASPGLFYIPLRLYMDRRWNQADRFTACERDLTVARRKFGPLVPKLARGEKMTLIERPEFSMRLQANDISAHEGFWALSLHDPAGVRLFNLSFGFMGDDAVLIGSLQGVRGTNSGLASIHSMTKAIYGLRPPTLLLHMLQMLCLSWGITQLWGIDPEHQVKLRRNAEKQRFSFDYRGLWGDVGGQRSKQDNWLLPLQPQQRSADEIPARKRAMYRKRYEWLANLHTEINQSWSDLTQST